MKFKCPAEILRIELECALTTSYKNSINTPCLPAL